MKSTLKFSIAAASMSLPFAIDSLALAQTDVPAAPAQAPSAATEQPAPQAAEPAAPAAAPEAAPAPVADAPAAPAPVAEAPAEPGAEIAAKGLKIGSPVTGSDGQQFGVINRVTASASGAVTSLDIAIGTKPGLDVKVFTVPADKLAVSGGNVSVSMSSEEALKSAASPNG